MIKESIGEFTMSETLLFILCCILLFVLTKANEGNCTLNSTMVIYKGENDQDLGVIELEK